MSRFIAIPALLAAIALSPLLAQASTPLTSVGITAGIPSTPVKKQGENFFKTTFSFGYQQGKVMLSGAADGTGTFYVDDVITVHVVRPDGTKQSYSYDFSGGCQDAYPLNPVDLSDMFQPGVNKVTVTLADRCGTVVQAPAVFLSTH